MEDARGANKLSQFSFLKNKYVVWKNKKITGNIRLSV